MSVNISSARRSQKENLAMTRRIAVTAVFTALAVVLMYLEVVLPFMPPFLKFDFSEIPVLVGAFALGPVNAVVIELLKNLIHLPVTATSGIGELSNFITGSIFVFSAGMLYKAMKTRKGAIVSMLISTLILTLIAIPLNYFLTLPLYASVLGYTDELVVGLSTAVNPKITSKMTLIMWGFVPFNLFKGIVVSFVTFWIYKPISKLIRITREKTA